MDLLTLYLKMTPPSAPKEDKTMYKIIGQIYFQEDKLDKQRQRGVVSVSSTKLVECQKVGQKLCYFTCQEHLISLIKSWSVNR